MNIIAMEDTDNLSSLDILDLGTYGFISWRLANAIVDLPVYDHQVSSDFHHLYTVQDFVNYTNERGSLDHLHGIGPSGIKQITTYMRKIGWMFDEQSGKWYSLSSYALKCKSADIYDELIKIYPSIDLLDECTMKDIIATILGLSHVIDERDNDSHDDPEFKNTTADKYTSEVETMINDYGTTSAS